MGKLLGISAPKEDPAVAAARRQQQATADSQLLSDQQADLLRRTRQRMTTYGFAAGPGTAAAGPVGLSGFSPFGPGAGAFTSKFTP